MSDRDPDNQPLFQNMDEMERRYAPEEVPGMRIPEEERDRGSDVGEDVSEMERDDDNTPIIAAVPGAGGITGSSGGAIGAGGGGVVPVVPVDDNPDRDVDDPDRRQS